MPPPRAIAYFICPPFPKRKPLMEAQQLEISPALINEMFADVRLRVSSSGAGPVEVSCGIFELGYDNTIPQSPLAKACTFLHGNEDVDCSRQAPVLNLVERCSRNASTTDSVRTHAEANAIPIQLNLRIGTPMFWTPQLPHRYTALISIKFARRQPDRCEIIFGIGRDGNLCVIERPSLPRQLPPSPDPSLSSIFIIGDSTAASNEINQLGWGDPLRTFFESGKINVLNRARAGRSTRSFIREGLWRDTLDEMHRGDIVLIQFGHNDADHLDQGRCRGVLPGIGDETREVAVSGGEFETVNTFGWYLRQMLADVRRKGGHPILLSPTAKNLWNDGSLHPDQGPHGNWSAQVASSGQTPFINAGALIASQYNALGPERVSSLFCNTADTVHTSPAGARLNAGVVASALRAIPNLPGWCY